MYITYYYVKRIFIGGFRFVFVRAEIAKTKGIFECALFKYEREMSDVSRAQSKQSDQININLEFNFIEFFTSQSKANLLLFVL